MTPAERRRIAAAHGLPEAIASRLQGDTAEEVTAHAEQIVAVVGTTDTGDAPSVARGRELFETRRGKSAS